MKKLIYIICTLTIIGGSCDTDCNDCDPYTKRTWYIGNNLNQELTLIFFANLGAEVVDEIVLPKDTLLQVYSSSRVSIEGPLTVTPFTYDSIKVYDGSILLYSFKQNKDCQVSSNPLCEENFIKIKEEKSKTGNTLIEYQIEIK